MAPEIARTKVGLDRPAVGGEACVDGIVGTGTGWQATDARQRLSAVSATGLTTTLAGWGGIRWGSVTILSAEDKGTTQENQEE